MLFLIFKKVHDNFAQTCISFIIAQFQAMEG